MAEFSVNYPGEIREEELEGKVLGPDMYGNEYSVMSVRYLPLINTTQVVYSPLPKPDTLSFDDTGQLHVVPATG